VTTTTTTSTTTPTNGPFVCRTPGFWATHAGREKGAPNLTQRVIDAAGGCIVICGEKIQNTNLDNANSAEEALCVNIDGESQLQLARQLMAAALNCVVNGGPSNCSASGIASTFSFCDGVCQNPGATQTSLSQCIEALDCFNNTGGTPAPGASCNPAPGNCDNRDLPKSICKAEDKCPASSSKKCNDANQNLCTVVGPGEAQCTSGLKCGGPETCTETTCP